MKINAQDFNDMAVSRSQGSRSAEPNNKAHKSGKHPHRDTVDTSRMSYILSRNAQDIGSEKQAVRYEKIEALKYIVDSKQDFSDAIIDKVLYNLTTS